MVDLYFKLSVVDLGIDPLKFWSYNPREIDLLFDRKNKVWREKHEFEAWKISWLIAPHTKDVKPLDIFDYDKQKKISEMTPEEEEQEFAMQFVSKEEGQKIQSEIITSKLKEINANKLKAIQENGDRT